MYDKLRCGYPSTLEWSKGDWKPSPDLILISEAITVITLSLTPMIPLIPFLLYLTVATRKGDIHPSSEMPFPYPCPCPSRSNPSHQVDAIQRITPAVLHSPLSYALSPPSTHETNTIRRTWLCTHEVNLRTSAQSTSIMASVGNACRNTWTTIKQGGAQGGDRGPIIQPDLKRTPVMNPQSGIGFETLSSSGRQVHRLRVHMWLRP